MDKLFYLNELFIKCSNDAPTGSYIKGCSNALYNQFKDISSMDELPFAFQSFRFQEKNWFETSIVNYPIVNVNWAADNESNNGGVVVSSDWPYPTRSNPFLCIHVLEFNGDKELFFASKQNKALHFISANKNYQGQHHVVNDGNWIEAFNKIPGYNINPRHIATIKLTPASSQQSSPLFELLSPIQDGVAEFHVNHFIGYFKLQNKPDLLNLNKSFLGSFAKIFNWHENEAWANSNYQTKFQGNPIVKFTKTAGIIHYLDLHNDWISLQFEEGSKSFFARTLKSKWFDFVDDTLPNLLPPPYNMLLPPVLDDINKRHFLAGRRSWKIGYITEKDIYYIETTAFERYSHDLYKTMETEMDLKETVRKIWIKLIENFADSFAIQLIEPDPEFLVGYTRNPTSHVYWIRDEKATWQDLFNIPWFSEVVKHHPGLST